VRDFERWVNKTYAKQLGKRPLTVYVAAVTRDRLLQDLNEGLIDMAVGNLSVTDERKQLVDFVAPDAKSVNVEILVTGPSAPAVSQVDELSGQTVHVRESSSYHASLQALNQRLEQAGKAPVKLVLVPDALEDEDMLEMVNAGLIGAIVVDDWKAKLWATVLPKLKLHEDVVLRQATLKERQEEAFAKHMKPTENSHAAFARSQRDAIIARVTEALRPKYGNMYGYDASMPYNVELAIRLTGSYY